MNLCYTSVYFYTAHSVFVLPHEKYLLLYDCCGVTKGSEQQHNQDLKEIHKERGILEFITFYLNALHLTTLFTTMHCI